MDRAQTAAWAFSSLYMSSMSQVGWPATCEVIKGREEIAGNCILELVCLQVQGQAAQEGISLQPCALSIALLAFRKAQRYGRPVADVCWSGGLLHA